MNDRQLAFDALVEALSAHFQEAKQTRVQKSKLLRLMYSRIDSGCSSFTDFVDCYQEVYSVENRGALIRAMRRSISLLSTWMNEHYARFPQHPIQFEILQCCRLRAVFRDDFSGSSVRELVEQVDAGLRHLGELTVKAREQFDGASNDTEVGGLSQSVASIAAQAMLLNKLQAALRNRI